MNQQLEETSHDLLVTSNIPHRAFLCRITSTKSHSPDESYHKNGLLSQSFELKLALALCLVRTSSYTGSVNTPRPAVSARENIKLTHPSS